MGESAERACAVATAELLLCARSREPGYPTFVRPGVAIWGGPTAPRVGESHGIVVPGATPSSEALGCGGVAVARRNEGGVGEVGVAAPLVQTLVLAHGFGELGVGEVLR